MVKKPKYWLDKVVSSNSGVSSKRVAGIFTLANIIVFCYVALLCNIELPEYMFDAICLLAGSLLGITTVENIFKKPPTDTNNTTNESGQ